MRHVRAMEAMEAEEGQWEQQQEQEGRGGGAGRGSGAGGGGRGRVQTEGASSEEEEGGRWDAVSGRGAHGAGVGGGLGRKRGRDEQRDSGEDSGSEGELVHEGGDWRHAIKQRGQEEQGRDEDLGVAETGGKRAERVAARQASHAAPGPAAAAYPRAARGVPASGSRASARVHVLHDEGEEEQGVVAAVARGRGTGVPDSNWGGPVGGVGQRGSLQEDADGGGGRGVSRGAWLQEDGEEGQLSTGGSLSARTAASEGGRGAAAGLEQGAKQACGYGKRGQLLGEVQRHGPRQKRGGAGAGLPTRAHVYRAMLLSRKPSAPLVPVAAPRRRAAKGAAQDRSRGQGN